MIQNDQGKMLRSLLNKPYRKISIDRIMIQQYSSCVLITEPAKLLEKTQEHFQQQFRKRNINMDEFTDEQIKIYRPKEEIQDSCYSNLLKNIDAEEWDSILKDLSTNTTPGISGIGYKLIKAAGPEHKQFLKNLQHTVSKEEKSHKNGKSPRYIQFQRTPIGISS